MREIKYVIMFRNEHIVDGINPVSWVPIGGGGLSVCTTHYNFDAAQAVLDNMILNAMLDGSHREKRTLDEYSVHEFVTENRALTNPADSVYRVFCQLFDPKSKEVPLILAAQQSQFLIRLVQNGFGSCGGTLESVKELILQPKYSTVVNDVVPSHMMNNFELFWDVGIARCDKDELAAIVMTSPQELLNKINFDKFNTTV